MSERGPALHRCCWQSDLLQVDARRLKTFRTFRDDGIAITGAGTPQEQEITVHRTVVEFIIQLEEPITNTDEELDPTQAAGLLIVRCNHLRRLADASTVPCRDMPVSSIITSKLSKSTREDGGAGCALGLASHP